MRATIRIEDEGNSGGGDLLRRQKQAGVKRGSVGRLDLEVFGGNQFVWIERAGFPERLTDSPGGADVEGRGGKRHGIFFEKVRAVGREHWLVEAGRFGDLVLLFPIHVNLPDMLLARVTFIRGEDNG